MQLNSPQSIAAKVGSEIGVSPWIEITQDMIDRFADLTDDHQFIHVNPELAAQTPFGGAIAHGFLVLAMISKMAQSADFLMQGVTMGVNYGFEKVRLIGPVRAGKRIRGRFVLKSIQERNPGQWMATLTVSVEIEDEPKPAVVADWLSLQFVGAEA